MKEQIKKLAESVAQVANFLKEEKTADAVATLETAATEVAALAEEAANVEEAAAAKDTELEAAKQESAAKDEQIAKYASLNISTEDLPKLFEELGAVKSMLTGVTEVMKSVTTKEDISSVTARLEAIEKAGASRQIAEENRVAIEKVAGLDLSPKK